MKHRKAFTLVELLVVIGIIAVLISILLPSLNKARSAARTAYCMANLRSIGQGLQLYANDNHDQLVWPQIKSGSTAKYYWWDLLAPYMGAAHITQEGVDDQVKVIKACPEYIRPSVGAQSYNRGYGMNTKVKMYINGAASVQQNIEYKHPSDGYTDAAGNWLSPAYEQAYAKIQAPWKYSKLFSPPSMKYIIGDASSAKCQPTGSIPNTEWTGAPPYSDLDGPLRHNLGKNANYLFLDGHVETLTPLQANAAFVPRN